MYNPIASSSEPSVNGDDEDDELDDLTEQLSTLTIDSIKSHCEPQYPQQVGILCKKLRLIEKIILDKITS